MFVFGTSFATHFDIVKEWEKKKETSGKKKLKLNDCLTECFHWYCAGPRIYCGQIRCGIQECLVCSENITLFYAFEKNNNKENKKENRPKNFFFCCALYQINKYFFETIRCSRKLIHEIKSFYFFLSLFGVWKRLMKGHIIGRLN